MNFKNILFFCFFFSTALQVFPQNAEDDPDALSKKTFKERLVYNVGGGITFGTITNIQVLPQVGYRITPRLTSGIGGNLIYFRDNRFTTNNQFLLYGGNVFTRYSLTPELFTQVEYQALAYSGTVGHYGLIGGGYMPGTGLFISAYYLFMYPDNNNIYGAPYVIRVGFAF
jgi:hypothetical protein